MERYYRQQLHNMGHTFDVSSMKDNTLNNSYTRNRVLDITRAHRNGFSKSLGDISTLTSPSGYQRKTVLFEEDLRAHAEMLERARKRFRQLELKYPEVFKNSSRASSITSLNTYQGSSSMKQPSIELTVHDDEAQSEQDRLAELADIPAYRKHSGQMQHRKAPSLSSSMRSHHLEDSCDSAFDEIDRESIVSQSPAALGNSPAQETTNSPHFLYPGDSLESDKDSGIGEQPATKPTMKLPKHAKFAELGRISKSLSLSQPNIVSEFKPEDQKTTCSSRKSRQGILKSSAFRNQGIRSESLDAEFPLDRIKYTTKRHRLQAMKTGSEVYRRSIGHIPSSVSQDDDCSETETIYSTRSELLVRPVISARQQYLSTYGLNRVGTDENDNRLNVLVKSKSLPNLGYSLQSSFDETPGFSGTVLSCDNPKKRKKRILQRFGRRSGLYVVNDVPTSEKPKHPFSSSSSWKKRRSKLKKSASHEPSHVNETTKVWYDHTTAVSRPSQGQVLGRVLSLREDLGMAYEIELQRPKDGLFGFFIQKGYKECRKGVFISRIMDSASAKFMAGLLNPGDELLELNGESTVTKSVAEVQSIMAHSDKLLLTVMPYVGRKDW